MTSQARHDLDQLLAAWARGPAAAPTLTPSGSARPIVPADPTLSATWWSDFNSQVSAAIARATTTPAPALATWT